MLWENVGVAPPYNDHKLAFRFANQDGAYTIIDDTSIKGWLPGKIEIDKQINLPENIKPGSYNLSIGIVDVVTIKPSIRLAIEGRDNDGWYSISNIEIIK